MNIVCMICKKTTGADTSPNLTATICGHVFHTNCLTKTIQSGRVCCQQCGRRVKATTLQRLYFNIIQTDSLALSNDTFLNVYKKKIELEHLIEIQRKRIEDQRSKIQGLGTELFSAKFNLERCWAKEKELNDEFRKISVFFGIICFLVGCFAYIIGSFVFGMLSSGNQNPQPRKGFFF